MYRLRIYANISRDSTEYLARDLFLPLFRLDFDHEAILHYFRVSIITNRISLSPTKVRGSFYIPIYRSVSLRGRGVSAELTEAAEETAVNLANACWQRTRCDDSARKDDLWPWDTPCRLLNFANGCAAVCACVHVCVHVRGGVATGRKTRRVERDERD